MKVMLVFDRALMDSPVSDKLPGLDAYDLTKATGSGKVVQFFRLLRN
jgi:hypothetical protein